MHRDLFSTQGTLPKIHYCNLKHIIEAEEWRINSNRIYWKCAKRDQLTGNCVTGDRMIHAFVRSPLLPVAISMVLDISGEAEIRFTILNLDYDT